MKQYCIYLRKSRKDLEAEARGEGESLARHEAELLQLAKRMDLPISQIYREVVSGDTIESRPMMKRLLHEVEDGLWTGVLVMEVERLARGDTIDQGVVSRAFSYSNTLIITPNKVYNPCDEADEEYFEFGLFMSRREYKTINRRLQRGRMASIREGKFVGNMPPYGYERVKLPKEKGFTFFPIEEKANIEKTIFDWYVHENIGATAIAHRLDSMGVSPYKGDVWTPPSIYSILCNPTYAGMLKWGSRAIVKSVQNGTIVRSRPRSKDYILVKGLHPAIVSEEIFNTAQYIRESRRSSHAAGKSKEIQNPLSGLIVCGECGRKMIRRPYSNGYPDTLMCTHPGCPTVSTQLSLVEDHLIQSLREWLENYKIQTGANQRQSKKEALIDQMIDKGQKNLQTLEKQRDTLHDFLEQGVYSVDVFLARNKNLSERIEEATSQLQDAIDQKQKLSRIQVVHDQIIPKFERVLTAYPSATTPKQKNLLLKEILSHVIYRKSVSGRWHADPGDFELTIFPILPEDE